MTLGGPEQEPWPGPDMPSPHTEKLPSNLDDADMQRPRRRRLWSVIMVVLVAALAAVAGYRFGGQNALRDERTRVEASASAHAAQLPAADLYCPLPGSDEARRSLKDEPVVVIDKPPAQRVVVMRKAVVVVVRAVVAGDLVVCGNDARLVLEKAPRASARILMQGGTDTKNPANGPMVFLVDGVTMDATRVWFSNKKPQIVECRSSLNVGVPPNTIRRLCGSYFSTEPPPTPTPSTTR